MRNVKLSRVELFENNITIVLFILIIRLYIEFLIIKYTYI